MEFAELVKGQNKKDSNGNKKTFRTDTKQWGQALCVKAVDVEKRQIRVLASTGGLDRDDERLLPSAFKKRLSIYQSNPVILAAHQHRLDDGTPPVVGRAASIWVDTAGLWCVIEFAKTELAEQYWLLYSGGFMKAVSIGFAPLAWSDTNENGKAVRIFTEVELFEISLVAVPANREALSKSNWLQDKKIIGELRKENPDFEKNCDEFVMAILGYKEDGEFTETDESDCGSRFELAKAVHPQGNYEENEFVRAVLTTK